MLCRGSIFVALNSSRRNFTQKPFAQTSHSTCTCNNAAVVPVNNAVRSCCKWYCLCSRMSSTLLPLHRVVALVALLFLPENGFYIVLENRVKDTRTEPRSKLRRLNLVSLAYYRYCRSKDRILFHFYFFVAVTNRPTCCIPCATHTYNDAESKRD